MIDIEIYASRQPDKAARNRLWEQWFDAKGGRVRCFTCDLPHAVEHLYRCLYCGGWFCDTCAETHFSLTIEDWLKKQRVQAREQAERKLLGFREPPYIQDANVSGGKFYPDPQSGIL